MSHLPRHDDRQGGAARGEASSPLITFLPRVIGLSREPGRIPAIAILPLRLFLGATFVYAGLQKFSDPQFFSPTAPGFIGRQMTGYVRDGSPLTFLLTHAIEHAAWFGALIALCEVLVGLSTLSGLLARLGALGGLAINVTFFLTATWTVRPYFLGADLPYAAGWLTLALTGAGPYSLDEHFFGRAFRARPLPLPLGRKHPGSLPLPRGQDAVTRAAAVRGLGAAAALMLGGAMASGLAKLLTPNKVFTGATTTMAPSTPSASAATPSAGSAATAPPGTTFLGNVKVLPVNSAGQYTDPISGDPALLIHLPDGHFVAYDAVCTHAGCTVEYDPTQHDLVCPCHGAVYDPAHGAQVVAGPAPQPLAALQVTINAQGNAYAKG